MGGPPELGIFIEDNGRALSKQGRCKWRGDESQCFCVSALGGFEENRGKAYDHLGTDRTVEILARGRRSGIKAQASERYGRRLQCADGGVVAVCGEYGHRAISGDCACKRRLGLCESRRMPIG
jgi:hypothetical protein